MEKTEINQGIDKIAEIKTKYMESFQFLQARKRRQAQQLALLSNLRRGDQNISSTLILTLFNRVVAAIYDDKIQIKFLPSQGINQEQINAYNTLAQSDYQEMDKAKLDYDWCWDTLFFGRGYMETVRFDTKKKILRPEVINPLAFGYDPYIDKVQEWRYYWKWITKSKYDLLTLQKNGVLNKEIDVNSLPGGLEEYLWQYKITRDQAREGVQPPIEPANRDVFQILEYYGYDEDGDRAVFWTDKNISKILYEKKLDFDDGDEIVAPDGASVSRKSNWPIVVKESFRVPHSSLPISIADLLEDKHRAKSVLLNLAYIAAKDQANPVYWFNDNVQDKTQFLSRQVNQHVKLDGNATGDNSVGPMNKASTMSPELISFITTLQQEANEPIGTGVALQPQKNKSSNTATEAAIDQQLNDMAQSIISKVMQFGEADFWSQWFHRYAKHADKLKEKTANIIGVKGVDSMIISLDNFKADYPPGVLVYSAKEAEYKNLVKRRDFMQLYPQFAQTLDQDGLRNFNKHVFLPLMIEDVSLIDIMYPKTLDEMKAEQENERLKDDQFVEVNPMDNHTTHIYMHYMVQPKNWATWIHIQWHEDELAKQKEASIMMNNNASQGQAPQGQQIGTEQRSPIAQATPLKSAINSDNLKSNGK